MRRQSLRLGILLLSAIGLSGAALAACSSQGSSAGRDGASGDGGSTDSGGTAGTGNAGRGGVGGSSGTGAGGAGEGGGAGAGECDDVDDCPAPADECAVATCEAGTCGTENLAAGETCSAGVCTGDGRCADCVPDSTMCSDGVPELCSADGEWVEQDTCPAGNQCNAGRCRGVRLDWHLQAGGTNYAQIDDVGIDAAGNAYVTGIFYPDMQFGGRTLTLPSTASQDVFVARVPPAGTSTSSLIQIGSAGLEYAPFLAVAPNGNHFLGIEAGGTLVRGPAMAPVGAMESFAFLGAFANNATLRFSQSFRAPPSRPTAMTRVHALLPTANGTRAYALFEFVDGVRWSTRGASGYQELTPGDCHTLLSELDAEGAPIWTATYEWCLGINSGFRKAMTLGGDGNLYIGANSGYGNAAANVFATIGDVELTAYSSAALAKIDPADGGVLDVLEIGCDSFGSIATLATAPTGEIVALVSCPGTAVLTVRDLELPAGSAYLVKFDHDLNPLDHQAVPLIGTQRMAVNPAGEIFIAGWFTGDVDFGAGLHTYQGTCSRCRFGDGFVAGYSADLDLLFSRTYGGPSAEQIGGLAADDAHLYLGLTFGDTIDFEGVTLNRTGGSAAAVVARLTLE